jgi:phosphomethylpyrimidine synthase
MLTRLESARKGILTDPMKRVAEQERVDPESLRRGIAKGKIIPLGDSRRESVPPEGETRMNHRLIPPVGFRTDS